MMHCTIESQNNLKMLIQDFLRTTHIRHSYWRRMKFSVIFGYYLLRNILRDAHNMNVSIVSVMHTAHKVSRLTSTYIISVVSSSKLAKEQFTMHSNIKISNTNENKLNLESVAMLMTYGIFACAQFQYWRDIFLIAWKIRFVFINNVYILFSHLAHLTLD